MALDLLCAVLLMLPAVAAVVLARSALRRWSMERAGRAYELSADYRPVAVRGLASVLLLAVTGALALGLPIRFPVRLTAPTADAPTASAAVSATAAARRAVTGSRPGAPGPRRPAPAVAGKRVPGPRPAAPGPRAIGHPAGGTLLRLPDATGVWLPPPSARPLGAAPLRPRTLPVLVAYLSGGVDGAAGPDGDDLFGAFVARAAVGRADPFLVVLPRDCAAATPATVDDLARRFGGQGDGAARAVLGVGPLAPCAVRAVLSDSDRFRWGVGVAGTYSDQALALPLGPFRARPGVLLAAASGDGAQRISALRLRSALRRYGVPAQIFVRSAADPSLGGGVRRRLLAAASEYLTRRFRRPPLRRPPLRRPPLRVTHSAPVRRAFARRGSAPATPRPAPARPSPARATGAAFGARGAPNADTLARPDGSRREDPHR